MKNPWRDPSHEGRLRAWDALTLDKIGRMSRKAALAWLQWNDPNGSYLDEYAEERPLTLLEAHRALWEAVKASRSDRATNPNLVRTPRGLFVVGNPACARPLVVQTVLLPLALGKRGARAWLRQHGFKAAVTREGKGRFLRARQLPPGRFGRRSFRTITFGRGIKAVVGCLK